MPRFSILVPVYNVEQFLPECLASIDNQSFKDFEVVLVDDGTKDKSGVICDRYAELHDNVKVIHKINGGLISARREGIKNAAGEYVVFLDSDDALEATALEEINTVILENDADLVIFNPYSYDGKNKKILFENIMQEGIVSDKNIIYDKLLLSYTLNALCFKSVKRDIIDIDRDYSEFFCCNFGEDLLQTVPLIKKAQAIFYLNKPLYKYRISSGMMRKYSRNYYWSYKKVNHAVSKALFCEEIKDFEVKCAINLLVAAYGATTQFKYQKRINPVELDEIKNDCDFIDAYSNVKNSHNMGLLTRKQRLVIFLLNNRQYRVLNLLFTFRK